MTVTYRIGDVFDRLREIPDGSIDLVLTSPPFLALRSYLPADHPDKAKEIGSEPNPAAFIDTLLALTAEWRRVLAPHGSICVELADTYAGSGGAGDGMRAKFRAGTARWDGRPEGQIRTTTSDPVSYPARGRDGWPLDKSICGIPHLYHLSLAYGRHLLTGEASPAGQWRVRNVVAWCRPNPPVGALGDKFRPATSYLTIACTGRSRYFDLDAVAPPLDYWEINTQPYKGSHYATWPEALLARPIKAMCPQRVCRTCGKPSERRTRWTDCGHDDDWRTGVVLDPFAGSGTTLAVAQGLGRDAIGIDLYDRNADLARERVGMFMTVVGKGEVAA